MKTLHGIHIHGYPNLFLVQPAQGANLISNVPHNLTESGVTIAKMLRHALDNGYSEIEVTQEAQDKWIELLLSGDGGFIGASPECTPGYYNNEGQPDGASRQNGFYFGGPTEFVDTLEAWRADGGMRGLELG